MKRGSSSNAGTESPLSFQTLSLPSPAAPQRTRRVVFNSCVQQGIIVESLETSIISDNDLVSDFSLDDLEDDNIVFARLSKAFDAPCKNSEDEDTDEEGLSSMSSLSSTVPVLIWPLPPIRLARFAGEQEQDNVRFISPRGTDRILEEELLPSRVLATPKLKRTMSSHNLSMKKNTVEMEMDLKELGSAGFNSRAARGNRNGGMDGGWDLIEAESDSDDDFVPIVRLRRRERSRGLPIDEAAETALQVCIHCLFYPTTNIHDKGSTTASSALAFAEEEEESNFLLIDFNPSDELPSGVVAPTSDNLSQ